MKKTMLASVLIAAALGEVAAQAQTFTYNPGDVLAAFRNGGANDLVVDLGSVANFQTPGYTTSLNLASDLTTAFGTLNGLYWSVFTYDANGTYAPANTVFMSDPQATVGVPNAPLSISSSQVTVGNQIQSLVNALSPTYGTVIDNQVIELPSSIGSTTGGNPAASYTVAAGPNADFNGTYGHNFENVSSTSATTASDLFQENPGERHSAVAAQNLGTITLDAAGNLSFQATPEPSTMAMVGTGLMSLIAFRRFAKKTNSRKNNYIHLKHNQKKQINNMKNTCLLAALGAVLATVPVMAANYDLYITGSTAFRPQVQSACYKMFDGGAPTSQIDSTGANPIPANDANAWSMSGTAANLGITSGSDTLTIHAFFTGSVQGLHAIENNDLLGFVGPATSSTIVSNYATIAFSDVYSKYTIAPLNLANFKEDDVAVQPFVFVKSKAPSGVASIQNVSRSSRSCRTRARRLCPSSPAITMTTPPMLPSSTAIWIPARASRRCWKTRSRAV